MSISSTTKRKQVTLSGATDSFATGIYVLDADELKVWRTRSGTDTVLTRGSHYSVSNVGASGGATVTMIGQVAGDIITVLRDLDYLQQSEYPVGSRISETELEQDLDYAAMRDQQLLDELDRCIKFKETATSAQIAGAEIDADATAGYVLTAGAGGTGIPGWAPVSAVTAGTFTNGGDVGVNVSTYGALGDGSTDDSAAIQSAIAYMKTLGGGTVWFPAGTYIISSSITIPSKVWLVGEGPRNTIIKRKSSASGNPHIKSENFDNNYGTSNWEATGVTYPVDTGFGIVGIQFNGNRAGSNTSYNDHGIRLWGKNYFIDRVWVTNCAGQGFFSGGGVASSYDTSTGLHEDASEAYIGDLQIYQCNHAFWWYGPNDSFVNNLICGRNEITGVVIGDESGLVEDGTARWMLLQDADGTETERAITTAYALGDERQFDKKRWVCIQDGTSSATVNTSVSTSSKNNPAFYANNVHSFGGNWTFAAVRYDQTAVRGINQLVAETNDSVDASLEVNNTRIAHINCNEANIGIAEFYQSTADFTKTGEMVSIHGEKHKFGTMTIRRIKHPVALSWYATDSKVANLFIDGERRWVNTVGLQLNKGAQRNHMEGQIVGDLTNDEDDGIKTLTGLSAISAVSATQTGTVSSPLSTSVVLSAGSAVDDYYNGQYIQILDGSDQVRYVSDYTGSTKTLTVSVAWSTTPASGVSFSILKDNEVKANHLEMMIRNCDVGQLTTGANFNFNNMELIYQANTADVQFAASSYYRGTNRIVTVPWEITDAAGNANPYNHPDYLIKGGTEYPLGTPPSLSLVWTAGPGATQTGNTKITATTDKFDNSRYPREVDLRFDVLFVSIAATGADIYVLDPDGGAQIYERQLFPPAMVESAGTITPTAGALAWTQRFTLQNVPVNADGEVIFRISVSTGTWDATSFTVRQIGAKFW